MSRVEYGRKFYENLKNNSRSAEIIVPIVLELLAETINIDNFKVVDMGCGTGHWLKVYKRFGASEIMGIDRGGGYEHDLMQIDKSEYQQYDLNKRFSANKKYDIAQCLETAEHIEVENAEAVVSNLVNLSDIILFSAAIPHQRGAHHVNEQWPDYWIKLFEEKDYAVVDCIREKIWNNAEVRGFYAQNLFLFCKRTEKNKKIIALSEYNRPEMFNLVHPAIWEELNNYRFMKIIDKLHDNKFFYWIYVTFIKKHYF